MRMSARPGNKVIYVASEKEWESLREGWERLQFTTDRTEAGLNHVGLQQDERERRLRKLASRANRVLGCGLLLTGLNTLVYLLM